LSCLLAYFFPSRNHQLYRLLLYRTHD
jgi:hypothetical protein